MEIVHTSVLLQECLDLLTPSRANSLFVDGTLGEGGHAEAFLKKFPDIRVIGIDADAQIQERAKERLAQFSNRVSYYTGWSHDFFNDYPDQEVKPDRILIDLGISLFHYEKSGRGFSFRSEEPLDMRLDIHSGIPASVIVNTYPEKKLADLIYQFAEEQFSRKIAKDICEQRSFSPFTSAKALAECIYASVPAHYRHGRIHPATKTFQALRIAVNSEIEKLPSLLANAFKALNTEGRLGVITFHSLEDRIVKNYFRDLCKACTCPPEVPICKCGGRSKAMLLTKKGLIPSEEEIRENSPSRSAKLRVIQKK